MQEVVVSCDAYMTSNSYTVDTEYRALFSKE